MPGNIIQVAIMFYYKTKYPKGGKKVQEPLAYWINLLNIHINLDSF